MNKNGNFNEALKHEISEKNIMVFTFPIYYGKCDFM